MERVSQFMLAPIVGPEGKCLGHVVEVRCAVDGDQCRIEQLVYGVRGFLTSIGFPALRTGTVEWQRVADVRDGKIILR
jgi:hypothetical protein